MTQRYSAWLVMNPDSEVSDQSQVKLTYMEGCNLTPDLTLCMSLNTPRR